MDFGRSFPQCDGLGPYEMEAEGPTEGLMGLEEALLYYDPRFIIHVEPRELRKVHDRGLKKVRELKRKIAAPTTPNEMTEETAPVLL